jgi:uncharacterized protein YhfF
MSDEEIFELGEPGPMRDRLVGAVLAGKKTATSSLLAQYEIDGEALPVVGDHRALIDSAGNAVGRIVLTEVSVIRLGDANDDLARDEGEGFRSASDWRLAHEAFWEDYVLPDLPDQLSLDDDTKVVVERFKLQ